ncbi:MAG: hypothetical protein D6761_09280 [Candidatus Dadabacteria bacterium]|nr:MAG: hypothetical protein D6761_09280 [Candidatus Dadabacteria bacterium]
MAATERKSLGQILTGYGIISDAELEEALVKQKETGLRLGEQLEALGYCTVEDVEWALSTQFDLPLVRLTPDLIDADAARLVPAGLARAGTLIPTWAVGNEIGVVIADPTNRQVIEAVQETTDKTVHFSLGVPSEIRSAITMIFGDAPDDAPVTAFGLYDSDLFDEEAEQQIQADPSGQVFLERLFARASELNARGVFFEHRDRSYTIRLRTLTGENHVIRCQRDWFMHLVDKLERLANARPQGALGARFGRYVMFDDGGDMRWGYEVVRADAGPHPLVTCTPFLRKKTLPDITEVDFGTSGAMLADALHGDGHIVVAELPNRSNAWMLRAVLLALNEPDQNIIVCGNEAQLGQERAEHRSYQLFNHDPETDLSLRELYGELTALLPDLLILQNLSGENPLPLLEEARLNGHKLVTTYPGVSALDVALQLQSADPQGFAAAEGVTIIAGVPVHLLCKQCRQPTELNETARTRYGIAGDTTLYRTVGCNECRLTGVRDIAFFGEVLVVDDAVKEALTAVDVLSAVGEIGWVPVAERLTHLLRDGDIAASEFVNIMRDIG